MLLRLQLPCWKDLLWKTPPKNQGYTIAILLGPSRTWSLNQICQKSMKRRISGDDNSVTMYLRTFRLLKKNFPIFYYMYVLYPMFKAIYRSINRKSGKSYSRQNGALGRSG